MELKTKHGYLYEAEVDTIIVYIFEGYETNGDADEAIDKALNGAIRDLIFSGDMSGKAGEVGVLYPRGAIPARRVVIVGLGKPDNMDLECIRKAAATGIKRARELNGSHVASIVPGGKNSAIPLSEAAQATAEGALLALYRYDALKNSEEKNSDIQSLTLVDIDLGKLQEIEAGVLSAKAIADGVYLTRDLINMPPNIATPTKLAETAREIASEYGMALTIGDREWAAVNKMGGFLAVAKGAGEPPSFIVMEHNAGCTDLDTIVLVGKGITFDTGGISIKPSERMDEMKSDMSGAAAVLGAMKVVGLLDLPLHIVGIAPCTENMPDANAYRPADVITASNGKTIEIMSTDAEGRMILSDALVYASRYKPKAVVDLATLTGACVIALGSGIAAGIFCNDDSLRDKLVASGSRTHERLWPLPLWDDYKMAIKSNVADMKNSGGRFGGVGTSAIFLKEFTDYSWAHLDIAGMALKDKEDGYTPIGGTAFGVRLLIDFLRNW
jgi:leucyl aminopeptidase